MFGVVYDFLKLKIGALNTVLTNDLNESTVSLDMDELPANQLDRGYEIRFEGYERLDEEPDTTYLADVSLKLSLGFYKKNIAEYEDLIDTYVHPLEQILTDTNGTHIPYTASNVTILDIRNIKIDNLNKVVKTNYIQPTLSFQVKLIDRSTVGATPLGAVTLLTPANNTGSSGNDFTWQTLAGATTYDFELSLSGAVILSQTNITITAFSVPGSILTTPLALYSWRVRGVNAVGNGAWSTQWNFLLL